MSVVLDFPEPELLETDDQHAFNLAVWEKVLADPDLRDLPERVETNRFGRITMSPPPSIEHSGQQFDIGYHLRTLRPDGRVFTECAISTSEGVKGADVAWTTKQRRRAQRGKICFITAPEICVEVFSPDNSRREMREKKRLYFEAGAEEVWFCTRDGRMEFYLRPAPEESGRSVICPDFPAQIDIDD